jgi:signal transduction histidine kinase
LSPEGFREELAARPALAWRTWWLCNATGYVTFTCSLRFLLAMRRQQWSDIFDDQRERRGYAAFAVLVLLAAAIGFPVWDVSGLNLPPDVRLAMTLVPAPLGFALAARFRGLGASAAVLLITPFAIISATGPNAQINWSDLPPITTMMHIYLLVLTATCWVLAAISRQLKWAVAEAVEAEKRKARYVATINHELRTPLNAILGFSELMRLQDLREEGQPFEDIHESGRRLLAMIEQLLSQSDRGASVFRLNKEPVRLARLLTRTIDEMRAERQREDCKVTLDASDQLIMHADSRALRQMMLVLLSQALRRVGPQSEIAVCASDNGSELIIDVETQRPADYAQDSREKLELQLLNALALAQGGRLETLRSGPRSRVVRLIFSSSVAVWKGKRVAGRQ